MPERHKLHLKHSGYRDLERALDTYYTAVTELIDDAATEKTSHDAIETLVEELHDDHATLVTWLTEVDGDLDAINNYLDFLGEEDGVNGGNYTMAATGAATVLGAGQVYYKIAGIQYYAALDTTITLEDSGDIADTKFGAWRVLISATGAVTTQDTGAQMAFANAETALMSLSGVAQTASTACVGYIVLQNGSGGAFNIGTTNTNAAGITLTLIYERCPRKQATGLTAALGSSLVVDAAATTFSVGTIDFKAAGVNLAQIGAVSNQAFDDADTVATTKFGGWVIATDYAQTGIRAIAADGAVGSVSAMTYASSAAAQTAIDNTVDRLPSWCCPIGQLIIQQGTGTFTAGTTNLDDAQTTATFTDFTSTGTWDRTSTTGADSHVINPPAVPATVTAPLLATLTAAKPASGPGALTASDPDVVN